MVQPAQRRVFEPSSKRRKALQARVGRAGQRAPDHELVVQLRLARRSEVRANWLAHDVRTPALWLRHDVLALAGPDLATRRELFDFIVAELAAREPEDPRRIRPLRVALQNQRDHLLAFTGVLDAKLTDIARAHAIAEPLVRDACVLRRLPTISPAYWQGWNRLRAQVGGKFHALVAAVSRAMTDTPRQLAGGEPQLTAAQLLHPAPPSRGRIPGPAAVLPEPPPRPAQPACRAPGQEPVRADDQSRPAHWLTLLGLEPLQPQRA